MNADYNISQADIAYHRRTDHSPELPSSGKMVPKNRFLKESSRSRIRERKFGKHAGRTDTLLKDINALAKQMQGLARQAQVEYSREVDAVILGRSRDPRRIEHLLDGILDFCFDPEMLQLYKKLCRHYFAINPSATAEYIHAYREMWDSEQKEKKPLPLEKHFQQVVATAKRSEAKKSRGKKGV